MEVARRRRATRLTLDIVPSDVTWCGSGVTPLYYEGTWGLDDFWS